MSAFNKEHNWTYTYTPQAKAFLRGKPYSIRKGKTVFSLHEKVVYPGYGVAEIKQIVKKNIAGTTVAFFELKFVNKEMTVLVPTENVNCVGIRPLSSSENIQDIFRFLAEPTGGKLSQASSNWNKRNKDYQCKLRTGNLQEICKIYRDLRYIAAHKELSFGEKNLLNETEMLLVEEVALVTNMDEKSAMEHLRSLCGSAEFALSIE